VHWCTGATKSGIVRVTIVPPVSDVGVAAELAAVNYLLLQKCVLGENRTGVGIKLVFSRGAVKKLVRKDSSKYDLTIWARYLSTRFRDSVLEVDKEPIKHAAEPPLDVIKVEAPPKAQMFSPKVGWFEVTIHALERYMSRSNCGVITRAWSSMQRRMLNPDLVPAKIPETVLSWKKIKHGSGQEIWKHPDDTMHYVFVPSDDGSKIMVTVFTRKDLILPSKKSREGAQAPAPTMRTWAA
jgi:hypothetical protein